MSIKGIGLQTVVSKLTAGHVVGREVLAFSGVQ